MPADRIARVVSTSDPQGEYVIIREIADFGNTATSSDSNIYYGEIELSDSSTVRGPGPNGSNDGVWVQDGDSLTVQYFDEDGDMVDSDTIKVDAANPEISDVEPADGTHTAVENPTLQFTVTDEGSGVDVTKLSDHYQVFSGRSWTMTGNAKRTMTEIQQN